MSVSYDRGPTSRAPVQRAPGPGSLAELLNVILDKGIVIDAWARVSVIGIEILTIEARVIVASVETYLRYAEAIGLTALAAPPQNQQVTVSGPNGQGDRGQVSEEEIAAYLSDHPEGVRLGELEAYFNVPRQDLDEMLNQLVEEDRARRDDRRRLYLPAGDNGDGD